MRTRIHDFLWSDITGLPDKSYSEQDIKDISEEIFRHIFRVYSELPSPYYQNENHYDYAN
jgi:type I restriction enzyme R subunit